MLKPPVVVAEISDQSGSGDADVVVEHIDTAVLRGGFVHPVCCERGIGHVARESTATGLGHDFVESCGVEVVEPQSRALRGESFGNGCADSGACACAGNQRDLALEQPAHVGTDPL